MKKGNSFSYVLLYLSIAFVIGFALFCAHMFAQNAPPSKNLAESELQIDTNNAVAIYFLSSIGDVTTNAELWSTNEVNYIPTYVIIRADMFDGIS